MSHQGEVQEMTQNNEGQTRDVNIDRRKNLTDFGRGKQDWPGKQILSSIGNIPESLRERKLFRKDGRMIQMKMIIRNM